MARRILNIAGQVLTLGSKRDTIGVGLKGYYSIRVNAQWRIIFKWTHEGAVDVDLIDYH